MSILQRRELIAKNVECQYIAAQALIGAGNYEEALTILGDKTPAQILTLTSNNRRKIPRTGNTKHGKNTKSAPNGGHTESTPDEERQAVQQRRKDIRHYAGISYLRGLCFAKQNALDRAKECYKEAVLIDVQCFEAFDQLMKNQLMPPTEEKQFLESLNFDSIDASGDVSTSQQAAEMTRMLYITRMSKHESQDALATASETLSTHYKLGSNADMLLSKAELLFVQCRFRDALLLTESILEEDKYNFAALPVHLACLFELNERNALFLLSHELADKHPEEPSTWLAIGTYYLSTGKIAEARRMFSKSSLMNPHFGPAWIGFAHTFAAEGEHDQAIAAYTTSARLFQGTHLPQMFLGMQNLQLLNMTLAREYLTAAHSLCSTDPLLLNELGVNYYHEENWPLAIDYFTESIKLSIKVGAEPRSWIATRVNLGHAYRRQHDFDRALEQFNEVLRQGGRDVGVLTSKALILLELGQPWAASVTLHEALDVDAQDPIANDLLAKALQEHELVEIDEGPADEQFDNFLEQSKERARITNIRRVRQPREAPDEVQ